ncbi:hypothetical protein B0H63DRAFT_552454 [Podospora didyma]|uniref:Uncharacterized protein n=1 Tax=Podospora didyma TaxID=330526 RepID=A0AAE0N4G6_9PEZI|nr:hypothetical protein B0H63DRAFT_552454 [Podospora didyma]
MTADDAAAEKGQAQALFAQQRPLIRKLSIFRDGHTHMRDEKVKGEEVEEDDKDKKKGKRSRSIAKKLNRGRFHGSMSSAAGPVSPREGEEFLLSKIQEDNTTEQEDAATDRATDGGENILMSPIELRSPTELSEDEDHSGGSSVIAELYLVERRLDGEDDEKLWKTLGSIFSETPPPPPPPGEAAAAADELTAGFRTAFERFLESHSKDAISQIPTHAVDAITIVKGNGSGPSDEEEEGDIRPFFAKWSRHVTQHKDQWKDEQRIRSGKPYDKDIVGDPKEKHIPHTRFTREPEVCRGYYLIAEAADRMHHALKECVSVLPRMVGGVCKAVLVFDPPQSQHRTRYGTRLTDVPSVPTIKATFIDDSSVRDRFTKRLAEWLHKEPSMLEAKYIGRAVREMLVDMILHDEVSVLGELSNSLDTIELSLGDDKKIIQSMPLWRGFFGEWRNRLFHLGPMLDYIHQVLHVEKGARSEMFFFRPGAASTPRSMSNTTLPLREWSLIPHLPAKLDVVEAAWSSMNKRIKGTYQSVMLTMSIIDSEKAMKEAAAVSKLTNLAFFFVPLSLVAAVFAMPLKEFQVSENMKIWLWITVSLTLMTLVYAVLYWKTLARATKELRRYLASFDKVTFGQAVKDMCELLLGITIIVLGFALVVGVFAATGVGVWKIINSETLTPQGKGGLSFFNYIAIALLAFTGTAASQGTRVDCGPWTALCIGPTYDCNTCDFLGQVVCGAQAPNFFRC